MAVQCFLMISLVYDLKHLVYVARLKIVTGLFTLFHKFYKFYIVF
jgi:hypothetical protein